MGDRIFNRGLWLAVVFGVWVAEAWGEGTSGTTGLDYIQASAAAQCERFENLPAGRVRIKRIIERTDESESKLKLEETFVSFFKGVRFHNVMVGQKIHHADDLVPSGREYVGDGVHYYGLTERVPRGLFSRKRRSVIRGVRERLTDGVFHPFDPAVFFMDIKFTDYVQRALTQGELPAPATDPATPSIVTIGTQTSEFRFDRNLGDIFVGFIWTDSSSGRVIIEHRNEYERMGEHVVPKKAVFTSEYTPGMKYSVVLEYSDWEFKELPSGETFGLASMALKEGDDIVIHDDEKGNDLLPPVFKKIGAAGEILP